MNFILAAVEVVGDSLPQPESKFSLPLNWGSNGQGFLHRGNKWVTRASACEVFDCLVLGMRGRSGGPEVVGDSLPQPESKFSLPLDWGSNGRGFLHRDNEWVTRASVCKVFDCFILGMRGRSGGPSGISKNFLCHCCVAGAVERAESNDKNQFFLEEEILSLCREICDRAQQTAQ